MNVAPKLADGSALVSVQSIESAIVPTVQSSPDKRRDTGLGLLAGLLVACGLVLAMDRLDKQVRTPTALAEVTGQPLLGALRTSRQVASTGMVVPEPSPAAHVSADEVRRLRAAVEQQLPLVGGTGQVVAVTSAIRREGRSTVAANLAAALSEVGHRCVLVDADLRNPAVAAPRPGPTPSRGCCLRSTSRSSCPPSRPRGALAVLPSSPVTSPTAVLASEQFASLLQTLPRRVRLRRAGYARAAALVEPDRPGGQGRRLPRRRRCPPGLARAVRLGPQRWPTSPGSQRSGCCSTT